MWQIYHYNPLHIVPELHWYKDFPRHLEEIKHCACSQKRGQTDSWCYIPVTDKCSSVTHSWKDFEKVIFNSIFVYLEENNLLCPNQSGFRPTDFCEDQFLSILHEIYKSFDCNPAKDVRSIFLDLLKAFDRVWHDGLI